jgi:protocatechuate 3,4-dioxygenase beta subunit
LRGHQRSDARGRVLFDTIYPGWYRGRTPHIHIKVHVGGNVVHTGQLFFADRTSDAVYRSGAYKAHGEPDTINAADIIYAQAGGHNAQVQIAKQPGHEGDRGQITVGVRT